MKAYIFSDELGANPTIEEIPADMLAASEAARATLVERIAETDEELTLKFLEGEEFSNEQLYAGLRYAVIHNLLVPVLCGSSLRNKGVQLLFRLCAICPARLMCHPWWGCLT